jgi:hypothetical protein
VNWHCGAALLMTIVKHWHTKVAGTTFKNADGGDRQHLIRYACKVGAAAQLVAEPSNPHDPNAHGVWIGCTRWFFFSSLVQLGYLSAWDAKDVASKKRTGHSFTAEVAAIRGGTDGKSLGVVLRIAETWVPRNER